MFTLLLVVSSATATPTISVELDRKTEVPIVTEGFQLGGDLVYASELKIGKCGSMTTKQPSVTIRVKEELPSMLLRFETRKGRKSGYSGALVYPGGGYLCEKKAQINAGPIKPGVYKVFVLGRSIDMSGRLRIELVEKTKASVKRAQAALPDLALTKTRVRNQVYDVKRTYSAGVVDVGGCVKDPFDQVAPLARVDVQEAGTWKFMAPNATFFMVGDGRCVQSGKNLVKGAYTLWAWTANTGPMTVVVDDPRRALAFAPGDVKAVGELDAPQLFSGKTQAHAPGLKRSGFCRNMSRPPDLFIKPDEPMEGVEVSALLPERGGVHIYGPLEEVKANWTARCHSEREQAHKYKIFDGTYAVWVDGPRKAGGEAFSVLVRRLDVEMDPLYTAAPVPGTLKLSERAVRDHLPFFVRRKDAHVHALFSRGPEALYLYAKKDFVEDGKTKLHQGEPLTLRWAKDKINMLVIRYNGAELTTKRKFLTTKRPEKIWLPPKPELKKIERLNDAIYNSGPEDKKTLSKWRKADDKYKSCVGRFFAKNGLDNGVDVIQYDGSGRTKNLTERLRKRAFKKCGERRLGKLEKKTIDKLHKTRMKRADFVLDDVREHFGLKRKNKRR